MTLPQTVEIALSKTNDVAWRRAIQKAAQQLQSGKLFVTLLADNTALITSENGTYRVNGKCPCASRAAHCYHRAAKRLVEMMEEPAPAPVVSERESVIADLRAAWNAKYANHKIYSLDAFLLNCAGHTNWDAAPIHTLRQMLGAFNSPSM